MVKAGDTLWDIAASQLGSPLLYQKLARANNIANPDYICIGQTIEITTSTTAVAKKPASPLKVNMVAFGALASDPGQVYAQWDFRKENLKGFKVVWSYQTMDGKWIVSENRENTYDKLVPEESKQSIFTIPSGAIAVQIRVRPIAENKPNSDDPYWDNTQWVTKVHNNSTPLTAPSAPTVKMEGYTLTATLDNINIPNAKSIEFQVYKNDNTKVSSGSNAIVSISATKQVSYTYTGTVGNTYRVRCRACAANNKYYSEWSPFSESKGTIPAAPSAITTIKASSETSVYLAWNAATSATAYEIQYAEKEEYFDASDMVTSKSGVESTSFTISGLTTGTKWFFRVRATNDNGESTWTGIKSIVIGTKPTAPTTWSSTATAVKGEPMWLYWAHNVEDGSTQTRARIELVIGGTTKNIDITNDSSSYELNTSSYTEGVEIKWRVRTAGVTTELGDWSAQRIVTIHAPVELEFSMTDLSGASFDALNSFPFRVHALAGPKTQIPTGYSLSIVANASYTTVDSVGNEKTVSAGEQIFTRYFDTSDVLDVELSASDVDLENGQSYTITCTVAMNSGLTDEASLSFTVEWSEESYIPDAEVIIDRDTYVAYIRPFCENRYFVYRLVDGDEVTSNSISISTISDVYTTTEELVRLGKTSSGNYIYYSVVYTDSNGNSINPVYYKVTSNASGEYTLSTTRLDESIGETLYTATGEEILIGLNSSGSIIRYCAVEEADLIEDIYLSVYRREFDGSFTEIESNMDNMDNTTTTDPHPALDFARYRIVATTKSTGAVGYHDIPAQQVGGKAVIIQWDEEWSTFEATDEGELAEPPWVGSLLKLPYNIDVSDSSKSDVSLIEYIGRSHPVSYYGTQLGESSTWNVSIPKDDEETLYALRRLARWMGDAYVREPSGSGYWAHVSVSFSQKHLDTTIPVTLNLTRVEGGK
jgi:hypothetical protein